MMADQNGSSRLDRIERIIEALVDDHIKLVDEHLKFAQEHRQLLTAQVLLTENVEKMRVEFAEARRHADERLNALIAVVDGIVRKREPGI